MNGAGTGIDNGKEQHKYGQIGAKIPERCRAMWYIGVEKGQQVGCCTVSVLASLFSRRLFTSKFTK